MEVKSGKHTDSEKNNPDKPKTKIYILILIILIILIVSYKNYTEISKKPSSTSDSKFVYECREENPCTECDAVINCIVIRHINELYDIVYFTIKNQQSSIGDCKVNAAIYQDNILHSNKTYKIGELGPSEKKTVKTKIYFPSHESSIEISPVCS